MKPYEVEVQEAEDWGGPSLGACFLTPDGFQVMVRTKDHLMPGAIEKAKNIAAALEIMGQ